MKITTVKVFKRTDVGADSFLGTSSVVFDNAFVVYGIRMFEKEGKRYLLMPSKKLKENWVDICHPINSEMRKELEDAIFQEYDKEPESVSVVELEVEPAEEA